MSTENTAPNPDPTDGTAPTDAPTPEGTAPDPAEPGTPDADAPKGTPSREAANYRRRLRALEAEHQTVTAERDALAERLGNHDRREVERMAADRLEDPRDLWVRTRLDDLRGEDGEIDADRLTTAIDALLELKPHWRKRAALGPDPHQGPRRDSGADTRPSFGASLRQQVGR